LTSSFSRIYFHPLRIIQIPTSKKWQSFRLKIIIPIKKISWLKSLYFFLESSGTFWKLFSAFPLLDLSFSLNLRHYISLHSFFVIKTSFFFALLFRAIFETSFSCYYLSLFSRLFNAPFFKINQLLYFLVIFFSCKFNFLEIVFLEFALFFPYNIYSFHQTTLMVSRTTCGHLFLNSHLTTPCVFCGILQFTVSYTDRHRSRSSYRRLRRQNAFLILPSSRSTKSS